MNAIRSRRVWTRFGAAAAGLICVATSIAVTASPAQSAPADDLAESVAAMQRDLGLTAEQAKTRLAQQDVAIAIDRSVRDSVGSAFGGSWFDAASGQLVVGLTSADSAAKVAALGARAQIVSRSWAELEAVAADLDRLAGKPDVKAGTRAKVGQRQAAVDGLVSWHIDPMTNSVVVSSVKGQASGAAMANLAGYGSAVRMEYLPAAPSAAAFMDGGDGINGNSCSAGFNLRNASTGQGFLLTAGHCVSTGQTVTGALTGATFGTVSASFFPTFDDALIRATNTAAWTQGHWVDINPSNGGVITINGFSDAPVGTSLCKSGIKTKRTCGTISAKDETVTFDGVNTVFGETRHSACVEKGDSGGSNYVPGSPNRAEGVTSGAVLYGSTLRCGSAVGQPTISWYFPFADSIAFYGPQFGVALWP